MTPSSFPRSGASRISKAIHFAITVVRATPRPERTEALHILHLAAAAADRKTLWCGRTQGQADTARADELADTATTVTEAHRQVRDGHWQLPPGSLVVIDRAAADPNAIADLAEHAAASQSGLVLVDTLAPPWPQQPSALLLRLLESELPWTISHVRHLSSRRPNIAARQISTPSSRKPAASPPSY